MMLIHSLTIVTPRILPRGRRVTMCEFDAEPAARASARACFLVFCVDTFFVIE